VLLVVGARDFPMLEGDARAFIDKAKGVGASATLFVAKECDHMGVVRSLIEDKSPTLDRAVAFLTENANDPR
jgi:hypothetical protein